jgi:hypothetical protein
MVELPPLLLTANIAGVLKICAQIDEAADPVSCDAARLLLAEPMALCGLVVALSRMQRIGRSVQVVGLSRQFKQHLESLDIISRLVASGGKRRQKCWVRGNLHAYRVKDEQHGSGVTNSWIKSPDANDEQPRIAPFWRAPR